jgi:tetratricopeptide (TPR) repeat protein
MNTAERIRHAVAEVERLRQENAAVPRIGAAVAAVKAFQSRRFAGTYADLLAGGLYAAAARFFLEELYNDRDYAERDAQFVRIAGAMEKLFPRDVTETAAALAELHALTESLDHAMAKALDGLEGSEAARYIAAWRRVGRRAERERQLDRVVAIGAEMARITRLPGLRLMLKMMRAPAAAAGLSSLQRFLEAGFDTFAGVAKARGGVPAFLAIIQEREQQVLQLLFDAEPVACETELARTLGQAR